MSTEIRKDTQRIAPRQVALPRVLEVGERLEATCGRWFDDRGYGWLTVAGSPDIFCGRRQLLNAPDLRRRDRVAFDLAMDHLGRYMASNVMLLDGEPLSRWQTDSDPTRVAIDSPSPLRAETFAAAPWEDAQG